MTLNFSPAIHPGEILREEFLVPLNMSAGALAKRIDVPRTRIERLVKGETPVTVDTALRLGKAFDTSPEFWLNMQVSYDLATEGAALADRIRVIQPVEGLANDNGDHGRATA
jgi:addiction module HigA family antidote